jgi:TPP-dependent indolepyruvate ferredoxin oxidoreductase alpha subunit
MVLQDVALSDRYDLSKKHVLLNGTQALVRLMMAQKVRDTAAGLNTAGYVTGYRGSPLGAVDMQMQRAGKQLDAHDVKFQPGLNEDLAATALWGTLQATFSATPTWPVLPSMAGSLPAWATITPEKARRSSTSRNLPLSTC